MSEKIKQRIKKLSHLSDMLSGQKVASEQLGEDLAQERKDEQSLQSWLPWAKELASYAIGAALAPLTGGTSLLLSGLIKSGTAFATDTMGDWLARDVMGLGGQMSDIGPVNKWGKQARDKMMKQVGGFRGSITDALTGSLLKGYTSAALDSDVANKFKSNIASKYLKSDAVPDFLKVSMLQDTGEDSITNKLIESGYMETIDPTKLTPEAQRLGSGDTLRKLLNQGQGTRKVY